MVLRACALLTTNTLTPSVQLTIHTQQTDIDSSIRQRLRTKQAGREASWLKEVRKVKRVVKSEKWVTRPREEK
jgi:hypothetical protein